MPEPTNRNQARPIRSVVPGRAVDFQLGGMDPDMEKAFDLIRELQGNSIGGVTIPDEGFNNNDVLLYDGVSGEWEGVSKSALLTLTELVDVVITTPVTDHVVTYDGSGWVNALLDLDALSDVAISAPATGHILRHNGTLFVNTAISGLLALDDLSDVEISAPAEGDLIVRNALGQFTNRNWVPGSLGVGVAPTLARLEVNTLDTAVRALVVKGILGQTAALIQGRSSTDAVLFEVGAAGDVTLADAADLIFGTTTGSMLGTTNSQKIGAWGATPVVRPSAYTQTFSTADKTLGAYTADDESGAYTGVDNTQVGAVYATVADLNALRAAYENLRAFVEDLAAFVNSVTDDLQVIGWLA